jgi:hypothetical protein
MNRSQPSFWKRPRGMVVLGVGGVLLLATGWVAYSRLGPSPASQAFTPAHRIDENALVAANAERPGETAPAPAAAAANAVEATSEAKTPPVAAAPAIGGDKPAEELSETERALDEAEAAIDRASDQVEEDLGDVEGGKPDR